MIIDEEFKGLLPALDKETFAALEANIIDNGCRDPLVLWGGILIDGYNRYEICERNGIAYNTVEKEFGSREEVMIWMISNQVSRRNMNPRQLSYFRGLHYRMEKIIVTNASGKNQWNLVDGHNAHQPKMLGTAAKLSEQYKVNEKTIRFDAKASEATDAIGNVSPIAKSKILSEEVKIDKKVLEALASATEDEIAEVAAQIEDGTYKKKTQEAPATTEPNKPVDSAIARLQPLSAAISGISDTLGVDLRSITSESDRTKLKAALRAHIDMLERLYESI